MTLNCKGALVDLKNPVTMGILNVTPDSFYDGGRYQNEKNIVPQVDKMLREGATFIDVGAQSSRPGAELLSEKEELERMLPIVRLLLEEFPEILLSIDTFRSTVASKCLEMGAVLINDISAGHMDDQMLPTIANHGVPYIMMHMRGIPKNMQQNIQYDNITEDILLYFSERMAAARSLGIRDIIIDPGFGFSKTLSQNYELLQQLELFQNLETPILIGISRKSMIHKLLDVTAEEALNGTTALHMLALQKGASILRVHDVKEAMQCVQLHNAMAKNA